MALSKAIILSASFDRFMSVQANPTAAILIIGDEILSGRTNDSNTGTIARFLTSMGIDLKEARVVGDEQPQIVAALNALRSAYDYVFTTGGIGPTHDDITADAVAQAFGVGINEREDALKLLIDRYGTDRINDNSRRMARIPEGAVLIANPVSAAPGFQLGNVFVLAGVPRIMQAMLEDVVPRLRTGQQVLSRTVVLRWIGESWAADALRYVDREFPGVSLGSYPYGLSHEGEFGTHLVLRSMDEVALDMAAEALKVALIPVVAQGKSRYPDAAMEDVIPQ